MSRAATIKDVLYALEFAGAHLVQHIDVNGRRSSTWSLEPDGLKVERQTAETVWRDPRITLLPQSKHGENRYGWVA